MDECHFDAKVDKDGFGCALLIAAVQKKCSIVEGLLELKNINKNVCYLDGDYAGYCFMHFLVLYNQSDLLTKYLQAFNVNFQREPNTPTLISVAVMRLSVDLETVALLLKEKEINVEKRVYGKTPLQWAVETHQQDKVTLLLQSGARLDVKDGDKKTPIAWAADNRDWAMIDVIMAECHFDANVDEDGFLYALLTAAAEQQWLFLRDSLRLKNIKRNLCYTCGAYIGYGVLHFLVLHNQSDLLKRHLQEIDINLQNSPDTPTPLSLAVTERSVALSIVELLLVQKQIDVDRAVSGKTPLQWAIETRQPEKVRWLLQYHARLDVRDHNGVMPLERAAIMQYWNIVEDIIAQRSLSESNDSGFGSALLDAAAAGRWSIVETLIRKEHIDTLYHYPSYFKGGPGYFALHYLVLHNQVALLKDYLQKIDVNKQFLENHLTALSLAVQFPQVMPETLSCLLKYGRNIDPDKKYKGNTPLHIAVELDDAVKVELLMQHDASLNSKNARGKTPEARAIPGKFKSVLVSLLMYSKRDFDHGMLEGVELQTTAQFHSCINQHYTGGVELYARSTCLI